MCGIAGILQWQSDAPFSASILTQMCDLMQRRGPDDSGVWVSNDQHVGPGFRRLAVVDLSTTANQPKRLLKHAVAGLLPPEIINRPKQGFGAPITEWFGDLLGEEARSTLRQFVRETDYFDPREVEKLIRRRRTTQMRYLYNLALWWRRCIRDQLGSAN